jgi:RHS repeat-associated protein
VALRPVTQRERLPVRNAPQEWVDSKFYSIVSDLVGMPTELIDHNAEPAWQARSTVWGELRTDRAARADIPLRFPGQYFDRETGLHYNFARYYDPETGRYQSDDPLGLAPSPNPRAYVPNPTRYVDPLGLTVGPGGQHSGGTGPRPILSDDAMRHAWDQHRWGGGYHQQAEELRGQAFMAPDRAAERDLMRERDRLMGNVLRQDMTYGEFSDRLRQAVAAHGDQPLIPRSANDPRGGGYLDHDYGDGVIVGANGQNGLRLAFGGEGGLRSAFPRFLR